jgi:hypothetical protein
VVRVRQRRHLGLLCHRPPCPRCHRGAGMGFPLQRTGMAAGVTSGRWKCGGSWEAGQHVFLRLRSITLSCVPICCPCSTSPDQSGCCLAIPPLHHRLAPLLNAQNPNAHPLRPHPPHRRPRRTIRGQITAREPRLAVRRAQGGHRYVRPYFGHCLWGWADVSPRYCGDVGTGEGWRLVWFVKSAGDHIPEQICFIAECRV